MLEEAVLTSLLATTTSLRIVLDATAAPQNSSTFVLSPQFSGGIALSSSPLPLSIHNCSNETQLKLQEETTPCVLVAAVLIMEVSGRVARDGTLPIISGNQTTRLFFVGPGAMLTLKDLQLSLGCVGRISGGTTTTTTTCDDHGGAIFVNRGTLIGTQLQLGTNTAGSGKKGGAIYSVGTGSDIQLSFSKFHDNNGGEGGAFYLDQGTTFSVVDSELTSNSAGKGAAFMVSGSTTSGRLERLTFRRHNKAEAAGGSLVYADDSVTANAIVLLDASYDDSYDDAMGDAATMSNSSTGPLTGFISEAGNAYATCASNSNVCGDLSKRCLDRHAQDHGAGPARHVVSSLGPTRSSTSSGVRTCVVDGKETICIMPLTQDDWVCKPTGSGEAHQAYCNGFKSSEVSNLAGYHSNFGHCNYATRHALGDVIKNQIKCTRALPFAVALRHDGSITAEDFFTQHVSSGVLVDQGNPTTPTGTLSREFSAESFDTVAIGCFNEKMELKSGTLHTQKASEWQALPFVAGGWSTSSNFREESKQYDVFGFSEYKTGA